ncbi:MAG: nickel-dependent lactate racemase [Cephaloticoccus sp.]|nr:nickel-dependent lactate racemase [Cephaloticoccus sp.]MCF7760027.1 nickel-dependent lactate racemase [Cephaloticoccus sp.]
MNVQLQYGKTGLNLDLNGINATVLKPHFVPGLNDEADAFTTALRAPINSRPLRDLVGAHEKVAVVIPDGTRPLPSDRLLPWLFAELSHVPPQNFMILIGTGSHRANTTEELTAMLGSEVVNKYRIVNHNAHDPATLALAGDSAMGYPVHFACDYVNADRRIILGFIEPHFMAGFSGGYKAVMPGLAGIDAIMHYHGARVIGDPLSTWGELERNPTQQHVRAGGSLLPIDFCINVTLNAHKQITRFFCGETMAAHLAGCAFSKSTAMVACPQAFPIVVTTNSGYPLDQNLYQTVKGMCAAVRIVKAGGLILAAARCNDGFPEHGNFRTLLFESTSPQELFARIMAPGFSTFDQWQNQLLAMVQMKARVGVHCEIAAEDLRRAHLLPVPDIRAAIDMELERIGKDSPVAVLPEGPVTIPYLA